MKTKTPYLSEVIVIDIDFDIPSELKFSEIIDLWIERKAIIDMILFNEINYYEQKPLRKNRITRTPRLFYKKLTSGKDPLYRFIGGVFGAEDPEYRSKSREERKAEKIRKLKEKLKKLEK